MRYLATPLAMTQDFFRINGGYGPVGSPQDYEERLTVHVAAETPLAACDRVWEMFQNVSDEWSCPDNLRSLMVGDVIRVSDRNGENVKLFQVASFGFEEVRSLKSIFPHATDALNGKYDDMDYAEIASEQADVDASE